MNRLMSIRCRSPYLRRSLKLQDDGKNNIQRMRYYGNYFRSPLESNRTLWKTKTILYQSHPIKIDGRFFSSSSPPPSSSSSSNDSNGNKKESDVEKLNIEETAKTIPESSIRNDDEKPGDEEEEEEQKQDNSQNEIATTSTSKISSFPWRHVSALEPLPRVLEEDDLSGLPLNTRSKFVRKVLAARELDVPWLHILFTKSWENELAQQFSWAFRRAVAGALSRTFQVPIDKIEDEESGFIKIDTTVLTSTLKSTENISVDESDEQKKDGIGSQTSENEKDSSMELEEKLDSKESKIENDTAKQNNESETTTTSTADDKDESENSLDEIQNETEEFVSAMLEESLLNIYTPLSEGEQKWGMKFQMKPLRWRLESAFVIPMFTRDDVKAKPKLKGSYQAIEKEFAQSGNIQLIREMGDQLAEETDFSGKRVIIADVSVDCLESIQFIDTEAAADANNNGNESKEDVNENEISEVTHLVRFEMVTSKDESTSKRKIGSWQIIDWDDMLQGNIWH